MSRRPNAQFPVITNGDMSQATLSSVISIVQDLTVLSYSLSWAGTSPVGTVSVQVSNDYKLANNGAVVNAGTWTTLPLGYNGSEVSSVPVSGNTGNGFIDVELQGAYAMQLIYTKTSGTGFLQAIFNAKVA